MTVAVAAKLNFTARDASGQRRLQLRDVRPDITIQDFITNLTPRLCLPAKNSAGAPQAFHAFHERSGRHLRSSESVGYALHNDDEIVLHPDVQAGGSLAILKA